MERKSLRTRLTLGVLSAVAFSLLAMTWVVSRDLRVDMEAAISARQYSTVSLLAAEIDRSVRERVDLLHELSRTLTRNGEDGNGVQKRLMEAQGPLLRLFNRKEAPLAFVFWAAVATFGFILVPAAPRLATVDFLSLPPIVWVAVLYLSVIATAVTFFLLQYASMRLPASKVLAYGYLTPSFIIVIEGLIGHGWASASVFLGALVTACGLVVMALLPD